MKGISYKSLLFNAVKEKLKGTGINKIVLQFFIETDQYNVYLSQDTNHSYKADVTEEEATKLKKILINKIVRKIQAEHDEELKSVIIQMNFTEESFEIFYEDIKDKVYKFTKF